MYIVYIWLTGVAGGRAVPPDVREEPGRALDVHSHRLLPLFDPVRAYRLTCFFSLTTLVMGGNGLSRPGGNLGFRI